MSVRIITDSTSDLPGYLIEKYNITVVSLKVLFGEEEYRDGVDITNEEFYAKMARHKELPTTAQVNPGEFVAEFTKHVDQGDEIIGIFISSKLSGTYNSAVMAREIMNKGRIYVIDSNSATFGLGLLVVEAAEMAAAGKSAEDIVRTIEILKDQVQFYGVIDNLENLKKGGRLSATSAFAGSILGIKPIISIKDGAVIVVGKARGRKKAFFWILENLKNNHVDLNNKRICIAQAAAPESLEEFKQIILKEYAPKEIMIFSLGPVIGTHAGAGCIGISCFG
ncbi:MAG: DegV family protein [Dehalobacter sp.]|nr:DegV family protein [Dehalobacter sp.]